MLPGRYLSQLALPVVMAFAPITDAQTQVIQGQIIDTMSGAPVARGFAVLQGEDDIELERMLTTNDGSFSFTLESPGSYVIRSERIGYAAGVSALLAVDTNQVVEVTLRVHALAQMLATIEVRGETRCGDPDDDPSFGALWTEARKALEAAAWTNKQPYTHLLHGYRRVRKAKGHGEIEYERSWQTSGFAFQPYASIPAERLAQHGFVVNTGGRRLYHGPDANVLLHDSFQQSHCFEAVTGERELQGLIGLAFSPDPVRELPDIEGVLWIDPEAFELRHIEYHYTNVELPVEDERLGGTIYFKPLSSGAWVLEEWQIRTPVMEYTPRVDRFGNRRTELSLVGIGEEGGKIIEVADDGGTTVYVSPEMSYVTGTVYDEASETNLTNHFVNIVGTGYATFTDPNGFFFFKTLLSGPQTLTTGRLDSLGYLPGRVTDYFIQRDTMEVQLVIPDTNEIRYNACPEDGIHGMRRAVVGFVQDAETGQPLQGYKIVATWRPERAPDAKPLGRLIAFSDSTGHYKLCGLPIERTTRIELDDEDYAVPPIELTFREEWVVMENETPRRGRMTPYRIWKVDLLAIRRQ